MSSKRAKKLRALWFHIEYGGNYPAMAESERKYELMSPSDAERRRTEAMIEQRKAVKQSNRCAGRHLKHPFCPACNQLRGDWWGPEDSRATCKDDFHFR